MQRRLGTVSTTGTRVRGGSLDMDAAVVTPRSPLVRSPRLMNAKPAEAALPHHRLRMAVCFRFAVGVLALLAALAPAVLAFDEPDGFGKAKFGMNAVQVKTLFPGGKDVVPTGPDKPPPIAPKAYVLENQSIGPLKNCRVELRFFNDEFYEAQCACPDKEKVAEYLKKTYGTASTNSPTNLLWTGNKTGISYLVGNGVFAIDDLGRSKTLTMSLLTYVLMKGGTPGTAPGAQATPSPPAAQ
jgi:hypothetical protein